MGYTEDETWQMTMRKLLTLWKEYKILLGFEKEYRNPDDIIPGEDVI